MEASRKLHNDLSYPESIREVFKDFTVSSDEALKLFHLYKDLIMKFKDQESFLPNFFNTSDSANDATVNPIAERLDNISYNLLIMEVSPLVLKHLLGNANHKENIDLTLNEKKLLLCSTQQDTFFTKFI